MFGIDVLNFILFLFEYLESFVSYIMFHVCYNVYFYLLLRTLSMGDLGYNAIKNKGLFYFLYFLSIVWLHLCSVGMIYLSRNEWDIDLPGGGRL